MQNTEANSPRLTPPKKKKKRASSLDRIKARSGWVFVAPFVIGFLIIYLPIVYNSIYYSFTQTRVIQGGGFEAEFVGFLNYRDALFTNPHYVLTLWGGILSLIFDIPAIVVFALFMAILLNQKMMGRAVFRVIFFIPVILSTGIIDRIDQGNQMLDFMQGAESGGTIGVGAGNNDAPDPAAVQIVSMMDFYFLFQNMRVGQEVVIYVVWAVNNIYQIVNRAGVQMLIFLGGLQSIPTTIYESAYIEGASSWETFWKITFQMISPMILVTGIYTVIDAFTARSNMVMDLIERTYNTPGGPVLASAMAWMYFLIVILMLALVGLIISSFVFYQRREN
jgi:ABC-type sugar transport system permease subunit